MNTDLTQSDLGPYCLKKYQMHLKIFNKTYCACSRNISWKNDKLHGITALVINFLTSNQLLVNINQLFETLEEKK